MEGLVVMQPASFWTGKRVLVTGHTGFKGGWLTLWLSQLGAQIFGIGLTPDTRPSFFEAARVERYCQSYLVDLRQQEALFATVEQIDPQVVLHLAAQPLVLRGYAQPVLTWDTNVMGTIHLLEALRACPSLRSAVIVTSDKCYENPEHAHHAFTEHDPLGGHDPYSSSKGATELVVSAWQRSYFAPAGVAALATARAGNVIGGGDWAADRLLPDLIRAQRAGVALELRQPEAMRPWQHVLEPLAGYLLLAQRLTEDPLHSAGAWNFGPERDSRRRVADVVAYAQRRYPHLQARVTAASLPHEAQYLALDSRKAEQQLNWRAAWNAEQAIDASLDWYDAYARGAAADRLTFEQIDAYTHAWMANMQLENPTHG